MLLTAAVLSLTTLSATAAGPALRCSVSGPAAGDAAISQSYLGVKQSVRTASPALLLLLPAAPAATAFCFFLLLLGVSQPQMPLPEAGEAPAAAAAAPLPLLRPKLRGVLGVCCLLPLGVLEPL
jgi:hypothetical protein